MRSTMISAPARYALGALALLCTMQVEVAHAKSTVSVTSTGTVSGTVVQGIVTITNSTSKSVTVTALKETLQVRFQSGYPVPALPPGVDAESYVVATLMLPLPGAIAVGGSVSIPFSINTCNPTVARYTGAKDMRTVAAVTAAGQVTTARSASFVPPAQSLCPVCGNGRVEVGEQCDGGGCCSSCRFNANGTLCTDANACTQVDQCQNGSCLGSAPVVCAAPDQCHSAGTCNPLNGTCSNPNKANGATCDDANACSTADRCVNGTCVGSPMSCSDGNLCTDDSCADGACVHSDNSAPCDDGLVCTDGDTCADGACTSGGPRDCDDIKVCTDDVCEEATACAHTPTETCDGCFADECLLCQDECVAANTQCATWCWEGFFSCLNGCTTNTYCAPFCQVDLGYCLAACPSEATCRTECETGNGCAVGCMP